MSLVNGFERVEGTGWRLGFDNLFARENRKWWATNRWWLRSLIWLVILGGLVGLVLFVVPNLATQDGRPASDQDPLAGALQGFFGVGSMALAIGISILMQDELVAEKQAGTAEWVLSKPVSRAAFFLAKLAAHSIGMLLFMVVVPSAGAYLLLAIYAGAAYSPAPFLAGLGMLALHTYFYMALTLMLGVLANRREMLLGTAMVLLLGGSFIRNFLPSLALLTPWFLPDIAGMAALELQIPAEFLVPVLATFLWSVIFITVALKKFQSYEF